MDIKQPSDLLPEYMKPYYTDDTAILSEWFDKMSQYPYAFDDTEKGNFELFYATMTAQTTRILKAPYGNYYITSLGITPYTATGHCFFWDKKIVNRHKDLYLASLYGITQYKLARIEVFIPTENKAAAFLMKRAGYNYEGTMLNRDLYGGKLKDLYIYAFYGTP